MRVERAHQILFTTYNVSGNAYEPRSLSGYRRAFRFREGYDKHSYAIGESHYMLAGNY